MIRLQRRYARLGNDLKTVAGIKTYRAMVGAIHIGLQGTRAMRAGGRHYHSQYLRPRTHLAQRSIHCQCAQVPDIIRHTWKQPRQQGIALLQLRQIPTQLPLHAGISQGKRRFGRGSSLIHWSSKESNEHHATVE